MILYVPPGPEPAPGAAYGMPSTNVTLETLLSTKVAVAQFSQTSRAAGAAGPGKNQGACLRRQPGEGTCLS